MCPLAKKRKEERTAGPVTDESRHDRRKQGSLSRAKENERVAIRLVPRE